MPTSTGQHKKIITFKLTIPNFDGICKKSEKIFSDLAYINELPWQVFALVENTHLGNDTKKTIRDKSLFDPSKPKNLFVYLQCNGKIGAEDVVFGKNGPAQVTIPNVLKSKTDMVKKFSAKFSSENYFTKINLGSVDQYFDPGFIQVDGSISIVLTITTHE